MSDIDPLADAIRATSKRLLEEAKAMKPIRRDGKPAAPKVGTRVAIVGVRYFAGHVGTVVEARSPSDEAQWPIWVALDHDDYPRALGFELHEIEVIEP